MIFGDAPGAGTKLTRRGKILRVLAGHSAALTASQLAGLVGEGIPVRQRELSKYGEALRGLEAAGLVARAGTVPVPPRARAQLWAVTDAGRARLSQDEAAARAAAEQRGRAGTAAALLAAAAAAYSRATPRAVRARAARELRDAGCTYASIGAVFGVTGEAIRQDLRRR